MVSTGCLAWGLELAVYWIDPWFGFDRSLLQGRGKLLGRRVLLGSILAGPVLLAQSVDPVVAPKPAVTVVAMPAAPWQEPAPFPSLPSETATADNSSPPNVPPSAPGVELVVPAATDDPSSPRVELSEPNVGKRAWKVFTNVALDGTYDDNLFIRDSRKESDFYTTIAATLAFGWGDYKDQVSALGDFDHVYHISLEEMGVERNNFVFATYMPSWTEFVDHTSENSFNNNLAFNSSFQFSKLTLGLSSSLVSADATDIDVGNRVHYDVLTEALNAHYSLGDKTSLSVAVSDTNRTYPSPLLSSNEVVNSDTLNYQILPKTSMSLGVTLGYLTVQNSPGQTYEQVEVGTTWVATEKFSLRATGGVEFRQTNSPAGDIIGGIFRGGMSYLPFDGTDCGLDVFRETRNSAILPSDDYTATGLTGSVRQRLFHRLNATMECGYTNAVYTTLEAASGVQREDNYVYGKLDLAFDLTKWASIDVGYQYRQNLSSLPNTTFHQDLANVRVNITF